jgi:hypothetical protein
MDGERDLSEPGDQQLAHMHPFFRGGCLLGELRQKRCGVDAKIPVTAKGMKRMLGRLLTPPSTSRTLSSQHGVERFRETGG